MGWKKTNTPWDDIINACKRSSQVMGMGKQETVKQQRNQNFRKNPWIQTTKT